MELNVWKSLLLQWVNKCEFIEDIESLEDSDIEAFFASYAEHAQVEPVELRTERSYSLGQLQTFLKDIYPNFETRLGNDGRLLPSEYVYVYTLLMHYTCVQSPSEYFHNICKNLPDNAQQCIALFFELTVEHPEMDRNRLHSSILSVQDNITNETNSVAHCFVSPAPVSPMLTVNKNAALVNGATPSSNPVTPTPTQRDQSGLLEGSLCQAPSTPKTQLLEQRTRELLGLRAQLETERYEKTVLEEQISENEHLINSLTKENKVKKMQLAKLEATIENDNNDDNFRQNYVPNAVDNLKRQLLKEINKKDALLAESREEIQELKNKHAKIALKLKESEKQVLVCMDQINDLELRLENVTQLLTGKDADIACLRRDKLELEQCLQEARTELHNGREVLNASSDLLETSQSAGSMNTTPETLACSVIDKQLREKELENNDLRDQIEAMINDKKGMLHKLLTFVEPHQRENGMPAATDDVQVVGLVGRSIDLLSVRCEEEQQRVRELQVQYSTLQKHSKQNEERIREQLQQRAEKLEWDLAQNQLKLKCFMDSISVQFDQQAKFDNLDQLEKELTSCLESMRSQLKATEAEMAMQSERLSSVDLTALKVICALNPYIDEPIDGISSESLHNKLKFLHEQIVLFVSKYEQLNNKCDSLKSDMEQSMETLREQHEILQSKHDELQLQCDKQMQELQREHVNCEELRHELLVEQSLNDGAAADLKAQKQVIHKIQRQLCEQRDEKVHLEQELKTALAKQAQLERDLRSQTELIERSETAGKEIKIKLEKLEAENKELNDSQKELEDQLSEEKLEKARNEQKLKEALEKRNQLEQQLKVQAELVQNKESINKEIKLEVEKLEKSKREINDSQNKLEAQLSEEKLAKTRLEQDLSAALEKKNQLEHKLKELTELVQKEESTSKELKVKLEQLEESKGIVNNSRQKLEDELREEKLTRARIEKELKDLVEKQAQLERDLKQQMELLRESESTRQVLQDENKRKTEKLEEADQKLNDSQLKLEAQLSEQKVEKVRIEDELKAALQKQHQLEQELKDQAGLVERAESKCKTLQEEISAKLQQLEQAKKEFCDSEKKLEAQLHDQRLEKSQLEQELKVFRETQKELEKQVQVQTELVQKERAVNNDIQEKIEKLEETNQELENSQRKLEAELSERKLEKTRVEEELKAAHEKQTQLEQELKEQKEVAEREEIKVKIQQLEESNRELNDSQKKLEAQLSDQKLEKNRIEEELKAAVKKQNQLESDLKAQTQLVQKGESHVRLLQAEIEGKEKKLEEASRALSESQKKVEEVQQKLEQTMKQLSNVEDLLKAEKQRNSSLQQEQAQQLEQRLNLEKELQASQQASAKREEELQNSKTQLDSSTKRLEKVAIKLGEQQALLAKTQREMSHNKIKQNEQAELITALQHEKESLQMELRKNKERAQRSEEKQASLEQQRSAVEAERNALQKQVAHLEKEVKKANPMRGLQHEMKALEKEKVNLVLEIGGLNSEIAQQQKQMAELSAQLEESKDMVQALMLEKEKNSRNAQAEQVAIENAEQLESVQANLAETQKELRETKARHEAISLELSERIKELNDIKLKQASTKLELTEKITQLEREHVQLKERELTLNEALKMCNEELLNTRLSRDQLREKLENESDVSSELSQAWQQLQQQTAKAQQHELDAQILQAKYRESKEEIARCEQKLKDQRIEMEGKLEKMKTKMRTLYTTEVTRMKEKQERDAANNKAELDKLNVQIMKYEEHTRKLSNQLVRLNEKLLEEQKKNAIVSTKLQHFQDAEQAAAALGAGDDWQSFKRPNAPAANLGSNLAMEDEEGEVFNNTYLTDLKLGTVPNMTAEELQYRNSLQPPHLKSAYAAQYDLDAQEDDIKDGPISLDDSMSALLSTTDGNGVGTRKKSMGTHYKRPGPPTPSKNGGRLSFGGSEPPREILRETCENGTAKTPARFKIFASRFSIGSSGIGGGGGGGGGGQVMSRDENSPPKRRLSNMFKRK